jgi:hypothetical protein
METIKKLEAAMFSRKEGKLRVTLNICRLRFSFERLTPTILL